MTFPASLHYSSLIRHIAAEIFHSAKFSKAWCGRLKLVVDELFMNSVRYGSTKNKSDIHITFMYDEEALDFIIEDDGTGENVVSVDDLKEVIQKNADNDDLAKTSGRGLSMITQQWTDSVEIEKSQYGGIKISFSKTIEETAPPMGAPVGAPVGAPMGAPMGAPIGDAIVEIKLDGEIDQSNIKEQAAQIHEKLKKIPEGGELVLNFENVSYVNSTFIGNLIAWYSSLEHRGGHIRLINLSDQIKEVFNVVGILKLLKVNYE